MEKISNFSISLRNTEALTLIALPILQTIKICTAPFAEMNWGSMTKPLRQTQPLAIKYFSLREIIVSRKP
jgi:hypothetical protein